MVVISSSKKLGFFLTTRHCMPEGVNKWGFGTWITDNKGGLLLCLGLGLGNKRGMRACRPVPRNIAKPELYLFRQCRITSIHIPAPKGALPQVRRLHAGFSAWSLWFNAGQLHLRFVVPEVACFMPIYQRPHAVCDDSDQAAHYHMLGLHLWAGTCMVTEYSQVCKACNTSMFEKRVATPTLKSVQFR